MAKSKSHKWAFKARFRRRAFGWRSKPPIQRIREAVSEIKKVARKDPALAAEGAVSFLERVSPAIEQVDSSSGAIGTAVNRAIDQLVPIVAKAPVDATTRRSWLGRLFEALQADQIPYIELLGDSWGELCATKEIASEQADDLIGITRLALSPDRSLHGHFSGTSACLSALYRAERFGELVEIAGGEHVFWPYKRWAVQALTAQGRKAEALRLDLATFRAVAKRYPDKEAATILADLVETTPGDEGKWFAAAKSVGLFEEALALARRSPCDPRTLTRAARDFSEKRPDFALGAGLLALHWLIEGYGYEITSADVLAAYNATIEAASRHGDAEKVEDRICEMVRSESFGERFVSKVLGGNLGLE